ncbi:hypothetical protein JTB14_036696 [Gonioctena quinquepunctata]|nr:hypothetical protein JTB14_036696 [Gonioctena quinquepunctata]
MWRPWINIDGASSSVPVKKKEIVKTLYSSLLNRGFNAAATELCDSTKLPLTTVKRITSNPFKSRRKRKDADSTECFDEGDKDSIRRIVFTVHEEQRVPILDAVKQRITNDEIQISYSLTRLWRILSEMGFRYRTIDEK